MCRSCGECDWHGAMHRLICGDALHPLYEPMCRSCGECNWHGATHRIGTCVTHGLAYMAVIHGCTWLAAHGCVRGMAGIKVSACVSECAIRTCMAVCVSECAMPMCQRVRHTARYCTLADTYSHVCASHVALCVSECARATHVVYT
jgi:hypothetical protein